MVTCPPDGTSKAVKVKYSVLPASMAFGAVRIKPLNGKVRFDIKDVYLRAEKIRAGVPQRSVLSPLLFLLYVNDIHLDINNDTKVACYADDIAI
ncbi:hypothetical protein TNCV_2544951 [Trichonephila clavipes]|nr:hypothetical protein TNCV_2544951 [Trichonephila clavipes]